MKYEAILFDMDGVLIDSEELMAKAGIMALHDFGIEAKPEDFIPFVGRGEDLYIGGVAEKYGHTYVTAMKDSAYAHYGDYVESEAFVPPEIPSVLFKLRDLGFVFVLDLKQYDMADHFYSSFSSSFRISSRIAAASPARRRQGRRA